MSEHSGNTPRTSTVFAIPEDAHTKLVQLRDHMRLMAQLTKVGGNASVVDPRLRPDAMAWCFSRMAMEADNIIQASWFSTELVDAYDAAVRAR